jgi:hypothetical protein
MIFMTEKDFYKVKDIVSDIENLKRRKRIMLDAVRRHFWWDDEGEYAFPSVCKQPMTDILCTYYDREIAMAQAKLNAIEIRFGNQETDPDSQSDTGV